MHYPRGLIRYATENGVAQKLSRSEMLARLARPRMLIYGAVLLAIASAFFVSLSLRDAFKVDVVRDRAALARLVEHGAIENVYRLQVMNASEQPQRYRIAVRGMAGMQLTGEAEVRVDAAQARWVTVAVRLPHESAQAAGPGAHAIHFDITQIGDASAALSEKSTFVVPR
jgi:polyferredoxin